MIKFSTSIEAFYSELDEWKLFVVTDGPSSVLIKLFCFEFMVNSGNATKSREPYALKWDNVIWIFPLSKVALLK